MPAKHANPPVTSSFEVVTGPAGSGKTSYLLDRYRAALRSEPPGSVLWLAPTQRAARAVRDRLLDESIRACFSPGVMTFGQFAEAILMQSGEPMRFATPWMKRQLVERLLDEARSSGRLRHFAPIADRPGFVDLVGQFIGELKRLEIWPEDFEQACRRRGLTDRDRELHGLYKAYQDRLHARQLYDAEGRFWSARDRLVHGQSPAHERLRLVAVDGFTDFTRTQFEMLQWLASHAGAVLVTLPLEAGDERSTLFAKTRETRARLLEVGASERPLPRPATPAWTALAHVEAELFRNPRNTRVANDTRGIEVCVAARTVGEIERLARAIKTLLVDGDSATGTPVAPDDVVVVFRSLPDIAPLVREVFERFGLPAYIETAEPLSRSRLLATLVNVLELAREDWPFRRLLGLVTSAYFQPQWPAWTVADAPVAVELAVRHEQIAAGSATLLERLDWRARQPVEVVESEDDDEASAAGSRSRARRSASAHVAREVLAALRTALKHLPTKATPAEWGQAIESLSAELGMLAATSIDDTAGRRDRAAWNRFGELLRSTDRLWFDLGEPAPQVDLAKFLEIVGELLRSETIPLASVEAGRVRVLSADSVRALHVDYLFFAGLTEKAFPPPEREGRLYAENEYRELREAGLPVALDVDRSQEEMLLFYEVLTRASRRLTFSYPGLDEKAQPLLPSPYLVEVERILGVESRKEMPDLHPVPRGEQPHGLGEWRLMAIGEALEGRGRLLAGLWQHSGTRGLAEHLAASLGVVRARGRREGFGAWEGVIGSEQTRVALARRFGPEHRWSPSDLERYAACPFQFFASRTLALEPLPELELEVDFSARGSRLHAVLARLHRRIGEFTGGQRSPASLDDETFDRLAEEAVDAVLEHERHDPLERAMAEIDRRLILRWLAEYRTQHAKYDATAKAGDAVARPAHFEVSFGVDSVARDALSTRDPLRLEIDGRPVLFAGRIDRVDVGDDRGQTWFNVLDYKTGSSQKFTKRAAEAGNLLQLPLYALAVENLLLASRGALAGQLGYWFVAKEGYRQTFSIHEPADAGWRASPEWEGLRTRLLERVGMLVDGVCAGDFPAISLDKDCTSRCEFATICRVQQTRALEKSWPNPR